MFYVYVLKSLKDGNYYIGQSNNIENRFKQHFNGKVKSTKSRRPLKVIGFKTYSSRNEATWIEYNLKKHGDKKKKFIDSLYKERPPARRVSDPEAYGPEGGEKDV